MSHVANGEPMNQTFGYCPSYDGPNCDWLASIENEEDVPLPLRPLWREWQDKRGGSEDGLVA